MQNCGVLKCTISVSLVCHPVLTCFYPLQMQVVGSKQDPLSTQKSNISTCTWVTAKIFMVEKGCYPMTTAWFLQKRGCWEKFVFLTGFDEDNLAEIAEHCRGDPKSRVTSHE